jgi:putative Ca2+/H+ antiporter (TMEM165/GDT1 family)
MDWKLLATVAGTVFVAELGDKTQLATLLFAAKTPTGLMTVFLGASLALVCSSGLGVFAGAAIAHYLNPKYLSYAAGVGFIAIGVWTLWRA